MGITLLMLGTTLIFLAAFPRKKKLRRTKIGSPRNVFEYLGRETLLKYLVPKPGTKKYIDTKTIIEQNHLSHLLSVESYTVLQIFSVLALFILVLNGTKFIDLILGYFKKAVASGVLATKPLTSAKSGPQAYILAILISLLGYKLPELVIKRYGKYKADQFEKELPVIEVYLLLLLQAKMNIKEILAELSKVSKSFRPHFLEAVGNYSVDQEIALNQLADRIPNKEFRNVIRLLTQSIAKDDRYVVDYIKRHLKILKSLNKFKKMKQTSFLENISALYIVVPLTLLLIWGLYPWLVYTIQSLSYL